jgi:hypothetical protein
VFRYLLREADGEPHDPPAYLSLIGNWDLDETFTLGDGQQRRIVAIDWEIDQELRDAGFDAIFCVEPL